MERGLCSMNTLWFGGGIPGQTRRMPVFPLLWPSLLRRGRLLHVAPRRGRARRAEAGDLRSHPPRLCLACRSGSWGLSFLVCQMGAVPASCSVGGCEDAGGIAGGVLSGEVGALSVRGVHKLLPTPPFH